MSREIFDCMRPKIVKLDESRELGRLLVELEIFESFSEFRRLVEQGGLSMEESPLEFKKIKLNEKISKDNFFGGFLLFRKGKREHFGLKLEI